MRVKMVAIFICALSMKPSGCVFSFLLLFFPCILLPSGMGAGKKKGLGCLMGVIRGIYQESLLNQLLYPYFILLYLYHLFKSVIFGLYSTLSLLCFVKFGSMFVTDFLAATQIAYGPFPLGLHNYVNHSSSDKSIKQNSEMTNNCSVPET